MKRARLKEKKINPGGEDKKEFKKVIREVAIPEQVSSQIFIWQKDQMIGLSFYLI